MQLSTIFVSAIVATVAAGSALPLRRSCSNAFECAIELGPAGVACAAAAVQAGIDPLSDAGCLAAVAADVVDLPASCDGCF